MRDQVVILTYAFPAGSGTRTLFVAERIDGGRLALEYDPADAGEIIHRLAEHLLSQVDG